MKSCAVMLLKQSIHCYRNIVYEIMLCFVNMFTITNVYAGPYHHSEGT